MTAIRDPYPESLIDDIEPVALEPADPLVRAINRLAQAVEQNTLAILDRPQPVQNAPQAPPVQRPALAPLPAVQVVSERPACTWHGSEKVAPSTNGKGGFYCQAKAQPGQPSNPKGYCTWHS
jgi:hypothetical protein